MYTFYLLLFIFEGTIGTSPKVARQDEDTVEPEISGDCLFWGLCENVPNYPTELAEEIYNSLENKELYKRIDIIEPTNTVSRQIYNPDNDDATNTCPVRVEVIHPRAGVDRNEKWHFILNPVMSPVQSIRVELCADPHGSCTKLDTLDGYRFDCLQKFAYRSVLVIDANLTSRQTHTTELRTPSCCSCMAKFTDNPLL